MSVHQIYLASGASCILISLLLLDGSIADPEVWKSTAIIPDSTISPCMSIKFYLMYFVTVLRQLLLCSLREPNLLPLLIISFTLITFLSLESAFLYNRNRHVFFRLMSQYNSITLFLISLCLYI